MKTDTDLAALVERESDLWRRVAAARVVHADLRAQWAIALDELDQALQAQ